MGGWKEAGLGDWGWGIWVDLILGEFDFKWIFGWIGVVLKVCENDVV